MKTAMIALSFFLVTAACFADSPSEKWQVATIMEVKAVPAAAADSSAVKYEVTLKVGNAEYVVLYSSPNGMDSIRYFGGTDHLVLIGSTTIKYNDLLGTTREVPIVSRRQLPAVTPANKSEAKR